MSRQSFGSQVYLTMRAYEEMALVATELATAVGVSSHVKSRAHIQSYLYARFGEQLHEVLLTGARRRSCLTPLREAIAREREAVLSWVTATPLGAPRTPDTSDSALRWGYEALLLAEFEERLAALAAPTGKTLRRTKKRALAPAQVGSPQLGDGHEN